MLKLSSATTTRAATGAATLGAVTGFLGRASKRVTIANAAHTPTARAVIATHARKTLTLGYANVATTATTASKKKKRSIKPKILLRLIPDTYRLSLSWIACCTSDDFELSC